MTKAEKFFFEYAGYGWTPGKETSRQGRERGAKHLAKAEQRASEDGYSFVWDKGSMVSEDKEPYDLWSCVMKTMKGAVVDSISGVDFGPDGEPWGDPYRRVTEAELALVHLGSSRDQHTGSFESGWFDGVAKIRAPRRRK